MKNKINPEMTESEIKKIIFKGADVNDPVSMPSTIANEIVKPEYKHLSRSFRDWAWDTVSNEIDAELEIMKQRTTNRPASPG